MKKYLKFGFFIFVVLAFVLINKKANRAKTSNALLLSNVEALAAEEAARTYCFGTGSVDCPITHVKVEYVIDLYRLE